MKIVKEWIMVYTMYGSIKADDNIILSSLHFSDKGIFFFFRSSELCFIYKVDRESSTIKMLLIY